MTAHAMKEEEHKCRAAGCSGFIPKPIDMDELVRTIASAVEGAEAERSTNPQADDPESGVSQEDAIKSSLPTDDPDFREVVVEFVDKLKVQMDDLQSAWERRELERVASLAHWMKGSGGTAGFDAFTAPAKRLEQLAKESQLDDIASAIGEIQSLVARVAPPAEPEAQSEERV
jgi:HPt (histidine-containing phosphotransfer) domain-containing protein